MIKVNSINQISKALSDFEKRVDPEGSSLSASDMFKRYASNLDKAITEFIASFDSYTESTRELLAAWGCPTEPQKPELPEGHYSQPDVPSLRSVLGFKHNLDILPNYVDFDSLSSKPSSLKDEPRLPEWFDRGGPCDFYYKKPPYGKIHILTEAAGKLRFICPYNTPFVHSTGLYSRARSILDRLRQDYSADQTAGHRFVQKMNAQVDNRYNVSADLSNFSDDISPDLSYFGLRCLDLEQLPGYLYSLPVTLPYGRFLIPNKLLMGLKGCFELSTVCHHYVVQAGGISSYAMVGDDLYYKGSLSTYLDSIKHSGWKLNRSKTVYSKTAAVFCGEFYWFGFRISPKVPKVSSCFHNGKRRKASALFSVTRDAIVSLNNIYNRRSVAVVIRPLLQLLRKSWKSVISLYAPQKLRGLGLKASRPGYGLLRILKRNDILRMSKLSIGIKKEDVTSTRWFGIPIELAPSSAQNVLSFSHSLQQGAVTLKVLPIRSAARKDVSSLYLSDVLEWYYYGTRLEPNQFGLGK
jgi:hypothetical protein